MVLCEDVNEESPGSDVFGGDRSEGFGERLLGVLLDRAHLTPPHLLAPLVAEVVAAVGGRDVAVLLEDYEQLVLVPLSGPGLPAAAVQPIAASAAGTAFAEARPVEVPHGGGTRLFLPLLDGNDQVGVLALTMDAVDDDDRRILRRLARLVAATLATGNGCTDAFDLARRRAPMSMSAEIQWALLPPLRMSVPEVEVAGILEPAYDVAGDSFDYALNGDVLHLAIIDAMGHGLSASVMATTAIGAYRHSRRSGVGLAGIYAFMDEVVAAEFGPEHFVTAQMLELDVRTGRLQWVNAGHPWPLLIRDGAVLGELEGATTLPVGFGGQEPVVSERTLRPGDRLLCFTDGLVEERLAGGEEFGLPQLIDVIADVGRNARGVRATVRELSHALKSARSGVTSDDATIVLVEWRGVPADRPPAG